MRVAFVGVAIADSSYTNRQTGELSGGTTVAVDDKSYRIPATCDGICEYDHVKVVADMRMFDKQVYFTNATIELASADDLAVLAGDRGSALPKRFPRADLALTTDPAEVREVG